MNALERLADVLRRDGGLIAESIADPRQAGSRSARRSAAAAHGAADARQHDPAAHGAADARQHDPAAHGATAASGPRADGRGDEYALLVEAIFEGYLQHYGSGRVVRPDDPDLELLAGDRLFALGLARLAELGDLAAVTELADVISLAAQAHAEGDPDRAAAIWAAGVTAVAHGGGPELEAAKAAARAGERGAAGALRATATTR